MTYKQLSLGFMDELDKRELEVNRVIVSKEISDKTKKHLKQLHKAKSLLSANELKWCYLICDYAKRNKRLSDRQCNVIEEIYIRQAS
jgi:D-ribose pyranose/furanose isomerase RbsD